MIINYLAVLVSAVVSFAIGFLWYGPLFGKQWISMMGFSKNSMKSMKIKPAVSMSLGFLSTLLMSYVLAMFVFFTQSSTIMSGITLGFWTWLGFIATTTLGSVLWENKSLRIYILNNSYNLISILTMAVILSVWK